VAGVVLVLAVSVRWPAASEFAAAIDRTQRANAAAEAAEGAPAVPVPPQPAGPQAGNGRHRGGAHRRTVRPTEPVPPGTMEW
jgi:hypothetical protein